MPATRKRKALVPSPQAGPSKRRAHSPIYVSSEVSACSDEEDEDAGYAESQYLIDLAKKLGSGAEDDWVDATRREMKQDVKGLGEALDEKEREIATEEQKFRAGLEKILTTALAPRDPVTPVGHFSRDNAFENAASRRPRYAHAQLLFSKSEDAIIMFDNANRASIRGPEIDDALLTYEKDKTELERLLGLGREVAKRDIEAVLHRPEDKQGKHGLAGKAAVDDASYSEADILEARQIFEHLSSEDGEGRGSVAKRMVAAPDAGLYPFVRDVESAVKRMVSKVPVENFSDEDDYS